MSALHDVAGAKLVVGDPLDQQNIAAFLPGHDVVISALGRRSRNDAHVLEDGAKAALAAMRTTGVARYIVVSQGLLFPSKSPIVWLLRRLLAVAVADSTAMEHLVKTSGLAWTIVRAPRLADRATLRGYRVEPGRLPAGAWSIGRADLAWYLVAESALNRHQITVVGVG
jgi:putative NADH-flavin reductase